MQKHRKINIIRSKISNWIIKYPINIFYTDSYYFWPDKSRHSSIFGRDVSSAEPEFQS